MSTNVEFALDNLKYRKDGKFDFEEFKGMHHLYPSVLFPARARRPVVLGCLHFTDTTRVMLWVVSLSILGPFAGVSLAERDDAGHGRRAVLGVEEA